MLRIFYLALMLMLLSGCTANNDSTADEEHYDEDGYMGLTSANPSLVATPNSHNHGRDIEMIKRALKEVPDISRSRIVVDGGYANIHVHVARGLSEEEAEMIKDRTERILSEMIPQYYRIRVTVDR